MSELTFKKVVLNGPNNTAHFGGLPYWTHILGLESSINEPVICQSFMIRTHLKFTVFQIENCSSRKITKKHPHDPSNIHKLRLDSRIRNIADGVHTAVEDKGFET